MRSLAIRSAEAAKITAALIEGSVTNAQDGVTYNAEVLAKLGEIDAQVHRVVTIVAEIAASDAYQRDGVQQISSAVEQLNNVTQQVAANAEESASASEELAGQAVMLADLVGTFRLESGGRSKGATQKPTRRSFTADAPLGYFSRRYPRSARP